MTKIMKRSPTTYNFLTKDKELRARLISENTDWKQTDETWDWKQTDETWDYKIIQPQYLPKVCFQLIKDFAGIHPTYRHKKIAGFIKHEFNRIKRERSDIGKPREDWYRWRTHLRRYCPKAIYYTPVSCAGPRTFIYYAHPHVCVLGGRPCLSFDGSAGCLNWNRSSLKDLTHYCRENKMRGFSKLNKRALITFIMKYNFD
jgi:hypothetical protein